ncbi:ABC transporter substrate-binding protein [Eionea flava]
MCEYRKVRIGLVAVIALSFFSLPISAEEKVLRLYHDADWSNNVESANAIWQGVHVALDEIDYQIQGYKIEIIKKDHRGNVVRSKRHLDAFLQDPSALAVVSGIHSPPLIKHRKYINENDILTLVPWAAGGPITRYPSTENWVFRLSVDDTKAGGVLVNYALNQQACRSPHLFLEDGPWGQSNLANMKKALEAAGITYKGVTRFGWNMKRHTASHELTKMVDAGADCVLLVANVYEGAQIVNAMAALEPSNRMSIISHWGIVGGDFHQRVGVEQRKKVDLHFIQSCFSFLQTPMTEKGQSVFEKAMQRFPEEISSFKDIRSPSGFIHGYDITQLLLAALAKVELNGTAKDHRDAVRAALENLQQPILGLVKTYHVPYRPFSDADPDAHEALNREDFCMGYYDDQDSVIVLK